MAKNYLENTSKCFYTNHLKTNKLHHLNIMHVFHITPTLLSQLSAMEFAVWVTNRTKVLVIPGDLYLQSTASSHGLVCVQGGAQLFAEEFADSLFNCGDSGGTSHNLHCIDIFFF